MNQIAVIKPKKIFITGGLGYIGTAFAKETIKIGYEVVLYDSLVYGQNYKKILKEISHRKKSSVKLIIGDTRNLSLLKKSLEDFQPDYVLHMGELSSVSTCEHNPLHTRDINYDASKKVLDLCDKLNIPVLYNSSSSVYGNQKKRRLMTEKNSVPSPTDNYCKYKLLMENYIKEKKKKKNFKIIVFRPATISGVSPRMRIELLPNHFTYCAVAKGVIKISEMNAYRAGVDIRDIINAYIAVIEKGSWKELIYNLGHYNLSKKQFAEGIKSVVDCKIEEMPSFGDSRNLQIDYSLFNSEFNFKPKVQYKDTIKGLAKWLKKNKNRIEKTNFVGILNMSLEQWNKII